MERNDSKMKNCLKRWKTVLLIALMVVPAVGCGKKVPKDSLTRPPEITLTAFVKEAGEITLQTGSYNWNYRISREEESGGVADAPSPLDETYPWEMMVLPASASGEEEYQFSFEWIVKELEDKTDEINWPDELMLISYDEADIGNMEAEAVETLTYTREDVEGENFMLPLHSGRVYDLVLTWSEEDYDKDGFYGTASYVFRTVTSEAEEE